MGAFGGRVNRISYFTLFQLYLVDLEADGSVACGSLGLDSEARWGVFQLNSEHRVGPGVCVLDLHVQVGQGSAVGHVLRDGDLIGFGYWLCQFSMMDLLLTWYSCSLNVGGSSLTSLIVIVTSAVDLVDSSRPYDEGFNCEAMKKEV